MSVLALTMGEPGGIGPELALRAWKALRTRQDCAFALIAPVDLIARRNERFGLDVPLCLSDFDQAAGHFAAGLPVIALNHAASDKPGEASSVNAAAVIASITDAVAAVLAGKARAIITNPIQKSALYEAGFAFPGHTEFLADLAARATGKPVQPVMMLASKELRAVPVTIHIPLRSVPQALTTTAIVSTGMIVAEALKTQFRLPSPRLAIAGLNPHAGEAGSLGMEDEEIVKPAVEALRRRGIDVRGPLPADTMFHAPARALYDAALCMYHDQALIPVKTLSFDEAVNLTLGLPFTRTSPDHGTALDIAGRGIADPSSLIAAIEMAADLTAARA